MKRNKGPKIIQISGIKGIFLAAFIVVCLLFVAGGLSLVQAAFASSAKIRK